MEKIKAQKERLDWDTVYDKMMAVKNFKEYRYRSFGR